jgi:hypothetical protein
MRSSGGYLFATLATTAPATAPQAGLRWRGPWASDPFLTARVACEAGPEQPSRRFGWQGVCRLSAGGRIRPGTERACEPSFELFLLGGLLVAVVVLGYLYWERQRTTVEIKLPAISIETH